MRNIIFMGVSLLVVLAVFPCFASEQQEKIYLVQILNQLDAIQPLILEAQKEQPKNMRIQFHYTKYRDEQGQIHNGLLEDIQTIREGIQQKINTISIEPRTVMPIKGDYINPNEEITKP